ncbi:MAG TPA: hypothetical protein VJT75_15555 [Thermoleophilaceae bacterium]|nr:hypothetical protein [Thermoleophilaceae bacterium]
MTHSRVTRRALLLIAPVVAIGIVAALWSVASRGDPAFTFDQQHPRGASDRELENLVRQPREPTPEGPGQPGESARCVPGSATGQRNPWTCTVLYPSGKRIRYRVQVQANGRYRGVDPTGQFNIDGCCTGTLSRE